MAYTTPQENTTLQAYVNATDEAAVLAALNLDDSAFKGGLGGLPETPPEGTKNFTVEITIYPWS